jgi:DNA (cytosine-5)-methyltransferase 1
VTDWTAVSTFAGIGGFDQGLADAGVRVTAAIEIDRECQDILARHFPDTTLFGDIREVTADELLRTGFVSYRGILAGGSPCQGFSAAGRGAGLADPRSHLFWQFVRLADSLRPRWVLVENVPGLLRSNGGRDMGAVIGALVDIGYSVCARVLDAQFFGVAQQRERLLIAGCLGDRTAPVEVLLEPESGQGDFAPGRTPGSRDPRTPRRGAGTRRIVGTLGGTGPGGGWRVGSDEAAAGHLVVSSLQGGGRRGHRIDAEGAAGGHLVVTTVKARDQKGPDSDMTTGFVVDGMGVRRLTPLESERLQGFADGWTSGQSDSTRYRQLGNAVPPPLIRWAGERIVAVEEGRRWLAV